MPSAHRPPLPPLPLYPSPCQPQLPPRLLPPPPTPGLAPLPAGALGAGAYSSRGGGGGRRFCIHSTMLLDSASAVKAAKALSPIRASSCIMRGRGALHLLGGAGERGGALHTLLTQVGGWVGRGGAAG